MNMSIEVFLAAFGDRSRYATFFDRTRLMYITHHSDRYTEVEQVKMAIEGGCDWIQLRMKDRLTLKAAEEIRRITMDEGVTCCLDDDLELALAAGIHCVHLGKKDMPLRDAWEYVYGKGIADLCTIGATANTFDDLFQADISGASYIGLGPYRYTKTKKKLSPILGLEGYQEIMKQYKEKKMDIPVFAIGGIRFEDIEPLMQTGITGIAVSGAILNAPDPVAETRRFIEEIKKKTPEVPIEKRRRYN